MAKRYWYTSFIKSFSGLLSLTLIIFFSIPAQSWSQCNSTGNAFCEDANVIGLPYTGRMIQELASNFGEPISGCSGQGFYHNTTWYQIIPISSYLEIQIIASNCTDLGAGQGIQAGLYTSCDPFPYPVGGSLQCDCVDPGQPIVLGGDVVPGVPLYIMLDGCAGSACDIEMVTLAGAVLSPITINLGSPAAPSTFDPIPTCPGAIMEFSVPPVADADIYTWFFPPGITILSEDCNSVLVEWGPNAGIVSVAVTSTITFQTNQSPPLFVDIDQPEYSLTRTFCGSSADGYLFYGDSILYEEGDYNIILPGIECDTFVNLSVINTEISLNLSGPDQFCENEGIASVTIAGSLPPFTYEWSNGATSSTIDNLAGGDYTVTVTDLNGCSAEGEITITTIELEYDWAATYCGSSADGYLFYGDNLLYEAGSYNITIPGNNCDTIVNLTVTNTQPILTLSSTDQACENEGMATVTTTGGVPPFTYAWSNGAADPTIDSLIIGDYTVTVTGGDGCTSEGATTISTPEVFNLTVNSTQTDCDEANGTASVTITGAVPNPAYSWSTGATDSLITALSPGLYSVTVTDTETSCQSQETVEITEAPGCSDDCPVYTVSDGNITVTGFNTERTKIRLWNTEGGWEQVFECDFDCNDPTVISGLSGEYHLKIDAFDDDYEYICKVDEDLVISGGPCIDNDDDGICASEDCDDNDPDFPVTPGTACNDNNPDTDNDQIQSDGCSCAGTTTSPPIDDCPTYAVSNGTITVTGFNIARTKIRLWTTEGGWEQVFECDFDCSDPTVITGLSGEYHLKIDAFDDDYDYICKVDEDLTISSGPCVDNDDDGICASEDCDDNDPNFPIEVGTDCNDNNPVTTNDQIQGDGCTCAGTPETTDCATIIMTLDDLTIIGNHPNQIIKVFNEDWEFVFQCSGDCPNPVVIDNLSEQVYHIKIDAYDSDWNFVCKVREDLIPGESASLRSDNTDFAISKLTIFPNPTRGAFRLSTKSLNGSGVVKIYNTTGQVIQQRLIKDFTAQDFLNFDLSNNGSGLYYVTVQLPNGQMLTERVVVDRH